MSWIQQIIPSQMIDALGWTLIHTLWQGAVLAVLLALALIFLRRNSSRVRYFVATSALFTLILAACITFFSLYQSTPPTAHTATLVNVIETMATPQNLHLVRTVNVASNDQLAFFTNYFNHHLPLIVTIWLLGVLVLMLRFLGGYALLQRMRHHQVSSVSKEWQLKTLEIAEQLKIKKVVRLLESAKAKTPMVLGHLKPIILLPLGTISGLSSKQVESILAHEIAHIARNDYLINILQSIVEIFLFFNPAMWWISAQVREEREHCCDDIALQMTNDHLTLAKTLATLEEMRVTSPQAAVALAGKKGGLVGRIRRIVNSPRTNATFSEGFVAAILLVGFLFLASFYVRTQTNEETAKAQVQHKLPVTQVIRKKNLGAKPKNNKKVNDTIRFGKFMIVTNPTGAVVVFKNGKIIDPTDYHKYEKDFAIGKQKLRIGKKGENPITIDIDPKKKSDVYVYNQTGKDLPISPTYPNPPSPPNPASGFGDDFTHSQDNYTTWTENQDGREIQIKWKKGKVVWLKIDGKVISPKDYHQYQNEIIRGRMHLNKSAYNKQMQLHRNAQHQRRVQEWHRRQNESVRQHQLRTQEMHRRNIQKHQEEIKRQMEQNRRQQNIVNSQMQDQQRTLDAIIGKMKDDGIIPEDTRNYRLSIQRGYIKINGKKLNKKQYEAYRQFILKITGDDISDKGSSWSWTSTHTDDD